MENKKPEYLKFRCCMCPNSEDNIICPPSPFGKDETPCRFIKTYIDNRGWKYKIKSLLGGETYCGMYQNNKHTGESGWHRMKQLPITDLFDKAQSNLNEYAELKGWKEFYEK